MYELIVTSVTFGSITKHIVTKDKLQEMIRELSKVGKYSFQYRRIN